jgi:MurNAc alpha-1-phosphate uridylyltransferase
MQCVILAGGRGTRMLPATEAIPKALLPVSGRPFAVHQLELLARAGVQSVVYCIGHLGQQIRELVGDGRQFGLAVGYVDEGQDLRGTAGALRLAANTGALDDRFLLTYGDSWLPTDYRAVERAFVASGAPALMTVFRNDGKWIPSNAVFADGWVTLYDKRPPAPVAGMRWADYGLSMLTRDLVEAEIPANRTIDLADVFESLSRQGKLAGREVGERFYEIGSPEGLRALEARLDTTNTRPAAVD